MCPREKFARSPVSPVQKEEQKGRKKRKRERERERERDYNYTRAQSVIPLRDILLFFLLCLIFSHRDSDTARKESRFRVSGDSPIRVCDSRVQ
jgi:hypothetical protein